MKKNQKGFSLIELIVTLAVFLMVMVSASNIFTGILTQYKQQSKVAETNIEGAIGLQLLQFDIERAGYGLPWTMNGATYNEAGAISSPWSTPWVDRHLNDGPPVDTGAGGVTTRGSELIASSLAPGAIRSLDDRNGSIGNVNCDSLPDLCSDVLSIKAANIATNSTAGKFGYITNNGATNIMSSAFGNADEDLADGEKVILMNPVAGINQKILQRRSSSPNIFYAGYLSDAATFKTANPELVPSDYGYQTYLIYGIAPSSTTPCRPFNRADYYVRRSTGISARCQINTGSLYKAVLNHSATCNDTTGTTSMLELPLMDCVADMQIIFALDTNADGTVETYSENTAALTAANLRAQLKEVRVYIVAHEGQKDATYTYTNPAPVVGCTGADKVCINDVGGFGLIKQFTVPDRNYRWKLYSLIVKPYNLR